MVQHHPASRLDGVMDKTFSDPEITGLVARVENAAGDLTWTGARGDIEVDSRFFIASTTKLYTTAIVLRLVAGGALDLATPITELVEGVQRLHVYKGTDYTPSVTVRHLLSHTSGLPLER